MSAKDLLEQMCYLEDEITAKFQYAEQLNELAQKTTVVFNSVMSSNGTDIRKREDLIDRVIDLRNEILKDIIDLIELKKKCESMISSIDGMQERMILELRYMGRMNWSEITDLMRVTQRTVFRIHSRAIRNAEQVYKDLRDEAAA